jgi:hypothetical protein
MTLVNILYVVELLFIIILGLLVRLHPIHSFSQRSRRTRLVTVLGNGLLCWIISIEIFMGLAASFMYDTALFYFNTTFALLPGMTRVIVESNRIGVIFELWSRQLQIVQGCFNSNPIVCQLANQVMKLSPSGNSSIFWILGILAFIPAIIIMLISRYFTRPQRLLESTLTPEMPG